MLNKGSQKSIANIILKQLNVQTEQHNIPHDTTVSNPYYIVNPEWDANPIQGTSTHKLTYSHTTGYFKTSYNLDCMWKEPRVPEGNSTSMRGTCTQNQR